MAQGLTAEQRRGPIRAQLDILTRRMSALGASRTVSVSEDLTLDEWETEVVRVAVVPGDAPVPAISNLMAEAVALRLKLAEDVRVLDVSGVASADHGSQLFQTLCVDVAIGRQQLDDLQQEINLLVRDQRFAEAKRLNRFHAQVQDDVRRVEAFLQPPDPSVAEAQDEMPLDTAIQETGEPEAPSRRRLLLLGSIVLVLAVVSLASFLLTRQGGRRPDQLTLEDFSEIDLVVAVEARPPSLFVTVDGERWRALDERRQLKLVDRMGRILADHGYSGALIRDGGGRSLAEWLAAQGSHLVPQQDTGST